MQTFTLCIEVVVKKQRSLGGSPAPQRHSYPHLAAGRRLVGDAEGWVLGKGRLERLMWSPFVHIVTASGKKHSELSASSMSQALGKQEGL